MEQPVELHLLKRLVGHWDVTMRVILPARAVVGEGALTSTEIVSGCGVRTELNVDISGLGSYEAEALWSFDRWGRQLHFFSIASSGEVHDHIGNWTGQNVAVFHWAGLHEGRPSTEDILLTLVSPAEIRVHEEDTVEGGTGLMLDIILKRQ